MILLAAPTAPSVAIAGDSADVYLSLYALRAIPDNRHAVLAGISERTVVESGFGGGVKAALFPAFTARILGIELEYFGHDSGLRFGNGQSAGPTQPRAADLIVLTSMANVIARCPCSRIQPYIGAGAGYSEAILVNASIPGRSNKDLGTTANFAYQLLGGAQADLWRRTFVFGEYKYLVADYHWSGLALNFRSHYAVIGFGVRF